MYLLNRSITFAWLFFKFYLHSTLYLLNRNTQRLNALGSSFTFHYVPIKSETGSPAAVYLVSFTFHYVPIKSVLDTIAGNALLNLHSTMYLLNLNLLRLLLKWFFNLHSTMYLLNPLSLRFKGRCK